MKKYLNLLIICFPLSVWYMALPAQDSTYLTIKTEAQQLFDGRKFEAALPLYRQLLYRFPKEPEYQFGTAVCLAKLNRGTEEAIALLKSVSNSGYNPLSYYYLGRLLHRSYLFNDAIQNYSRFMLAGRPSEVQALEVERQIEMARNGIGFTQSGRNVRVLDVDIFQTGQLEKASAINGSGKLVRKPVDFCNKTDLREGYRPLMYLPVYTEMNDYVFVSGYEKRQKDQRQIYRLRNINHETWSAPELLNNVINTAYDEEFPYFDAKTSVLYFSSKGHSSMGGYDIFKSVYDWNTKSWSAPENLGFPVNSPYDDYFYMTDEFSQNASFVSDRSTGPGFVSLYKIRLMKDTAELHLSTPEEMQSAANLKEEPAPAVSLPARAPDMTGESDTAMSVPPIRKNYNKILSEALNMQLRSDSLGRMARNKRLMARETPDEDLKKQLVTDILKTEKESKRLQREADLKFDEARKIKAGQNGQAVDTTLVISKNINDIRVYNYDLGASSPAGRIDSVTKSAAGQAAENSMIKPESRDEFSVGDKSPYDQTHPIPKGLAHFTGLVYRIQLGAFSKSRQDDAFGGISPVCYEQVNNTSILKYYAGLFYSLNSVTRALELVKKTGFPDAFIVAYIDGKPITTEKAREFEFAGMKL